MTKSIKNYGYYLLFVLVAIIITWFTQFAALYGKPTVTQPGPSEICNTTAFYKPSLPPKHDAGLPLPFISHYVADGGCGVGRPIVGYVFIIDCSIWFLILLGLKRVLKNIN